MIDHKVIEKIQKLLTLANSDNENEAKLATSRANELLLKYNLNLQQVTDYQAEYVINNTLNIGLTMNPHQKFISQILIEYFFVKVIVSKKHTGTSSGQWATKNRPRAQYSKTIQLVGTKENCQIAAYIFVYLNEIYPRLWKEYYSKNSGVSLSHRYSYYQGLTVGLVKLLNDTRWRVQEETGLVLKDDPKLKEFVKKHSNGTYGSESSSSLDREVYNDGVKEGLNITLKRPVESTQSQDVSKRLTGSKR